jgi:hypothetical protein
MRREEMMGWWNAGTDLTGGRTDKRAGQGRAARRRAGQAHTHRGISLAQLFPRPFFVFGFIEFFPFPGVCGYRVGASFFLRPIRSSLEHALLLLLSSSLLL